MLVQIDLRKEAFIRIVATASFPVITFGPFATPEALMTSLSHAIGMLDYDFLKLECSSTLIAIIVIGPALMCLLVAGTMQMPPKWALGYQQCRWSYLTAARVSEVRCLSLFIGFFFTEFYILGFVSPCSRWATISPKIDL